jgi:molybdopterin-containing oxidoreductase family iron-sulfur binding subunit
MKPVQERIATEEEARAAQRARNLTRRVFLGKIAAVAGVAAVGGRELAAHAAETSASPMPTPTGMANMGNGKTPEGDIPQWAMVIDIERCDGCNECTKSCQAEHFTGDQEWIKVFEMTDEGGNPYYLPRPCMQCENAPCLSVCPVGATFRNANGTVLIDHDKCIGCRFCMAACPYDARSFNWDEPVNPPAAALTRYTPEYPVPHRKGTVDKCMFCAHEAAVGKLPACAVGCPMSAIWFGDLVQDIATNGLETVKLSWLLSERNAFRLKEDLGTRPRVWYLPGRPQEEIEPA